MVDLVVPVLCLSVCLSVCLTCRRRIGQRLLTWLCWFCSAMAFSFACRLHLYRWFWNQIFTCNDINERKRETINMDSILLRLHGIPEIETIDGIGCCCGVPTILYWGRKSAVEYNNQMNQSTEHAQDWARQWKYNNDFPITRQANRGNQFAYLVGLILCWWS